MMVVGLTTPCWKARRIGVAIALAIPSAYTGAFDTTATVLFRPYSHGPRQTTSPNWRTAGGQENAQYSYSMASAGDVNGDGYDDLIVGAPHFDHRQVDSGKAFLFYGSKDGLSTTPAWSVAGDQASGYFGISVASAGDVNQDGYSDVLVSAANYSNGETAEGRVYLYLGSSTGLSTQASWLAEGNRSFSYFGRVVASAGDVNADGYSDVIIGAPAYFSKGRAFLYLGSPSGLSDRPAWTMESEQIGALLGEYVASAGDVNGDGFDDVLVSSPLHTDSQPSEGRVYLFTGSESGLSNQPAWMMNGGRANAVFGDTVSSLGDVDGDGYSDIIVGAPRYNDGLPDQGAAFVFFGSLDGLSTAAAWAKVGNQINAQFASYVGIAGDINGDGYRDAIVAARLYDNEKEDAGRVYVYSGSPAGLSLEPVWTGDGNQELAYYGWIVGTAGDVNGDGFSDYFVGSRYGMDSKTSEGLAFVYHGAPDAARWTQHMATTFPSDPFWAPLGMMGPLFTEEIGFRAYDQAKTALTVVLAPSPKTRIIGWIEDPETDLPYASVGSSQFVRAKFSLFYSGPGDSRSDSLYNRVPNFRLSLRTRGMVTTKLEVNHNAQTGGSPAQAFVTRELAPSKDALRPSTYRVDFDPVDVPYFARSTTEGIQRAFESMVAGGHPHVEGVLALTESSIGTYPALSDAVSPIKTFATGGTKGAADFDNDGVIVARIGYSIRELVAFLAGPRKSDFYNHSIIGVDINQDPGLISKSPEGITVHSSGLPNTRLVMYDAALVAGVFGDTNASRLRIEAGTLYCISVRIRHDGPSNTTPYTRFLARTAGFGWIQTLELTGARGLPSPAAREGLAQILPGLGNQVSNTTRDGTIYHLLFNTPLHPDIRADVPGSLAQQFPNFASQPGPGNPAVGVGSPPAGSLRNINFGFTVGDSLSLAGPATSDENEIANNMVLNRIEVRAFPDILD